MTFFVLLLGSLYIVPWNSITKDMNQKKNKLGLDFAVRRGYSDIVMDPIN
ncbi:hypothetical protein QJS10_CPB22g01302 [Acorus calamus]|uniref:Uncharacterized protein n=1 Tax=Acorus calamus TaxID=4465 RepID=A0AAV9C291_ACOCL|nr:hypothetical protein QJS10_CPB22g01302 [Acorus calamus]